MMLLANTLAVLATTLSVSAVSLPAAPIESRSDFTACLAASSVTTLTSSSSGYNDAILTFNRRLHYSPVAVVYPTSAAQVASVVKCAASSAINVVARSGGHSYAAYGLGGKDGSLVIDLSKLKTLTLDAATGNAVSGTGNLLGDLAQGLWDKGKRALPHGTCPYVGTGGHASFGGFGFFSRKAGLLMDRIVSAEVVTANGTVLTASSTSHPDLFWALRGAAPSYGIVTSWTFATLPAPPININYHVTFPKKLTNAQAVQIIGVFQTFAASKPRNELSMVCQLGVNSGAISMEFVGTYYGPLADLQAAIKPFTSALQGSPKMTTKQFDWYGGLTDVTGPLSTTNKEPYDNFFAKSLMTIAPLSSTAVTNWVNYMIKNNAQTNLWWWVEIDMYGGAVGQPAPADTAFVNRAAILTWQFYGGTPDGKGSFPSNGVSFLNGLLSSLQPNPSRAYPNYVDPTLTADQWHKWYFGPNYARLVTLKKAWDPTNVFKSPQSIPTA